MSKKSIARVLTAGLALGALSMIVACTAPGPAGVPQPTPPQATQHGEPTGGEALLAATLANDAAEVERLIGAGADADYLDASGRPVLVSAAHANAIDAARLLIGAGADVNAKDAQQDSAYLCAGAEGRTEILSMTLANGADLASTNRYGGTALIPACEHGDVKTVGLLLETGIDIDHINNLGWTCLLEAVILGSGGEDHQEVVRMLIAAGADVGIADGQGVTALDHARQLRQGAVARLLEEATQRRQG